MKRCIGIVLGILFCVLLLPVPEVWAAQPEVSAQACILMEAATGQVLYSQT